MYFWSALAGSALLVEPGFAATLSPEQAVKLVQEICIEPSTPQQIVHAGEAHALQASWSLDKRFSGPRRGLVASSEEAQEKPPMFEVHWWNLDPATIDAGNFNVWTLGSAYPKQKVNTCQVSIPGAAREQVIAIVKSALKLGEMKPATFGVSGWVLSGTVEKPDEGFKVLVVSEQTLTLQGDKSGTADLNSGDTGSQMTASPGLPRAVSRSKTGVFTTIGVLDLKSEAGRYPQGAFP